MKHLNDVNYKDCVGKVFKSLNSGDFKVLKYNNGGNVEIEFLKTGYEMVTRLGCIKSGSVKDRYLPSVYSVGIIGAKYPSRVNGVLTREYKLWMDMLRRCYSDGFKKKHPAYKDCEVSENFKSYEYFYEWCNEQIGFGVDGFEIDKDLLIKGNKVYSENICIFIPPEINLVLVKRTISRGEHLIGVYWNKKDKVFVAQVSRNKGKPKYLGAFTTEIEAFNAYKQTKENYIKELANKWKGKVDPRAYEALMNYTVDIDD